MIAVVIVNYESAARTAGFVREELPKLGTDYRTVIVDNTPGGDSFTEGMLPPGCVCIPSGGNVGFARGNNLGAEYAREHFFGGDLSDKWFLFTNNDIRIDGEDVVRTLVARLEEHPEAGIAGPRVVGTDGRLQSPEPFIPFADRHLRPYLYKPFHSREYMQERFPDDYAEKAVEGLHYRIMGSFFVARAEDWFACGGFDPGTFLYAEEPILSERLKKTGKGVWYCPAVTVFHEHGATTGRHYDKKKIRRMRLDSEIYYYRNYIGLPMWQAAAARVVYFFKDMLGR